MLGDLPTDFLVERTCSRRISPTVGLFKMDLGPVQNRELVGLRLRDKWPTSQAGSPGLKGRTEEEGLKHTLVHRRCTAGVKRLGFCCRT
jgi:hypothetical protein